MTLKRETVVTPDPTGMIESRSERASVDIATATPEDIAAFQAFMDHDAVGSLQRLLTGIEGDITAFWRAHGLPDAPGAFYSVDGGAWTTEKPSLDVLRASKAHSTCQHPAMAAEAGTLLAASWRHWATLVQLRTEVAAGNLHRAVELAFAFGVARAEVRLATHHGRDAQDGRRRQQARRAGGRAKKRDDDVWDAILRNDRKLQRDKPWLTINARAEELALRHPRSASAIRKYLTQERKSLAGS